MGPFFSFTRYETGVFMVYPTMRELDIEENILRERVNELSSEQRKSFYGRLNEELKDPDTYAVLNWLILAGLHNFYLKKIFRGFLNLLIFIAGVILLFNPVTLLFGVAFIIGILLFELPQLFFSQRIVKQYNNNAMRRILEDIQGLPEEPSQTFYSPELPNKD